MEDNVSTTGLVSGLWLSFLTLGGIIGPLLGGYIYERIGFQNTTLVFIGIEICMLVFALIYIVQNRSEMVRKKEIKDGDSSLPRKIEDTNRSELKMDEKQSHDNLAYTVNV